MCVAQSINICLIFIIAIVLFYHEFVFSAKINQTLYGTRIITIRLSTGKVSGRLLETELGNEGWTFQGVPYAEPPVKDLRFALPADKRSWHGVLDCYEYKPACWQNISGSGETVETDLSDDCLYANVFAGSGCLSADGHDRVLGLCPVIYYIHGGGNEFDSPRMFDPLTLIDNFASKNLVYVTLAYRLGVFGFWSTGTDEAIGNWALHDMVKGAEWIQREIRNFGGDSSRVTVMGHSSAAMAISLLAMSPKVARMNIFNQTALLSGSSCMRYGALSQNLSDYALVARKVGCLNNSLDFSTAKSDSLRALIECMRRVDFVTLGNTFNEMRGSETAAGNSQRMCLPRIDGPNGLLPWPLPFLMARRKPVKMIIGTTSNELGFKKILYENSTESTVSETCDSIVQKDQWHERRKISEACLKEYTSSGTKPQFKSYDLGSNNTTLAMPTTAPPFWAERVATLIEDHDYFAPCHADASSAVANGATVYLYSFDYEKAGLRYFSPWHSFDMAYLNGLHADEFVFDENDRKIAKLYQTLFINFASYGDPTHRAVNGVLWQPLQNSNSFNFLSVNMNSQMKPSYHEAGVKFWNEKTYAIEYGFDGIVEQQDNYDYSEYYGINPEPKAVANNDSENNDESAFSTTGIIFYASVLILLLFNIGLFSYLLRKPNRTEPEIIPLAINNAVEGLAYGSIAE